MDQWGDPLKPVPKWQNRLGYSLFFGCMGYLVYVLGYSKYKSSIEEQEQEELRRSRNRKAAALAMARANQDKMKKENNISAYN